MSRVKQIVVYRIRPESREDFEAIKEKMIREGLEQLRGLETSTTDRVLDADDTFVDTMVWSSRTAADAGNAKFESLATARTFLGLMAGPPLTNVLLENA